MHCADCHFKQDSHGTGVLYNEPRAAIEIGCVDCHGSIKSKANGITSGEAALEPTNKNELTTRKTANRPLIGRDLTRLSFRAADGKKLNILQTLTTDAQASGKKCKDLDGKPVVFKRGDIVQNSMVELGLCWKVKQTVDTVNPAAPITTKNRRTPRRCKRTTPRGGTPRQKTKCLPTAKAA